MKNVGWWIILERAVARGIGFNTQAKYFIYCSVNSPFRAVHKYYTGKVLKWDEIYVDTRVSDPHRSRKSQPSIQGWLSLKTAQGDQNFHPPIYHPKNKLYLP